MKMQIAILFLALVGLALANPELRKLKEQHGSLVRKVLSEGGNKKLREVGDDDDALSPAWSFLVVNSSCVDAGAMEAEVIAIHKGIQSGELDAIHVEGNLEITMYNIVQAMFAGILGVQADCFKSETFKGVCVNLAMGMKEFVDMHDRVDEAIYEAAFEYYWDYSDYSDYSNYSGYSDYDSENEVKRRGPGGPGGPGGPCDATCVCEDGSAPVLPEPEDDLEDRLLNLLTEYIEGRGRGGNGGDGPGSGGGGPGGEGPRRPRPECADDSEPICLCADGSTPGPQGQGSSEEDSDYPFADDEDSSYFGSGEDSSSYADDSTDEPERRLARWFQHKRGPGGRRNGPGGPGGGSDSGPGGPGGHGGPGGPGGKGPGGDGPPQMPNPCGPPPAGAEVLDWLTCPEGGEDAATLPFINTLLADLSCYQDALTNQLVPFAEENIDEFPWSAVLPVLQGDAIPTLTNLVSGLSELAASIPAEKKKKRMTIKRLQKLLDHMKRQGRK